MKRPRMLLLQARRPDDPMAEHERRCFVAATGLGPEQITAHDLCQGPPTPERLERHDLLSCGGSGEFSAATGNLPHWRAYLDFLRTAIERRTPTFASCFGYQSLVCALGGAMVHDADRSEVGTYRMQLTEDGRNDPLFGKLPVSFMAQMGHKDRTEIPPPGTLNLASSDLCRFQALRVPGKPVWACQFHPELDRDANLDRLRRYMRQYGSRDRREQQAIVDRFKESPETSCLLPRFVELIGS